MQVVRRKRQHHYIVFKNYIGEVKEIIGTAYKSLVNARTAADVFQSMTPAERGFCLGPLHDSRLRADIESVDLKDELVIVI